MPNVNTRGIIPGFGLTLGCTILFLSIATLLPLGALAFKTHALSWGEIWGYLSDPRAVATFRLTFVSALVATLINVVIGILLALILVRYEFPGRRILDGAIDVPFALPTAVAGLALAALTVLDGPVGRWFAPFDIKIAYAFPGIVLAMVFTSLPFVVRTVQPVLADADLEQEEAAQTLGAGNFQIFRKVIFPEILPATIAGGTLAFVRSVGEFGAIVFIAGNLPFRTEVTSLLIFIRVDEFDYPGAATLATAVMFFALFVLITMNWLQAYLYRRRSL